MKTLWLIGGPMGVGKTTACRLLQQRLPRCAFLDGDWCWEIHPFTVTEETKALVMDNIVHLLRGYLACTAVEHVVFCWVMHQQAILDELLAGLPLEGVQVHTLSLICTEEELIRRLQRDVDAGLRQADVIPRSLERLSHYAALGTRRLDVTRLTPVETAEALLKAGGMSQCVTSRS
ncbi:MAG: AAA family ATPase [Aristaeellaceae bacterium]